MGILGTNIYAHRTKQKVKCPFSFSAMNNTKKKTQRMPTLKELAEEKFGDDRALMLHIQSFLSMWAKKKQLPTHLSWSMQLQLLEKFPKEERAKQVVRSIQNGYKALAYENNLLKKSETAVNCDKEDVTNVVTNIAY